MADLNNTVQLFQQLKTQFDQPNAQLDKCKDLLNKLKLESAKLSAASSGNAEQDNQRLTLLREILEYGALVSVQLKDIPAFERYVAQLKPYYYDHVHKLPASSRQNLIVGLNLLHLLSKNKLDEFHTELELIPATQHFQDVYVRHAVQLEQYMMEGSYNKILKAKDSVPAPSYAFFMDQLMNTVRNEIAGCIDIAYNQLKIADAQKLLGFSSSEQVRAYAAQRNWQAGPNAQGAEVFTFAKADADGKASDIPSMKLIQQQLQYARELERII
eukprot:TRINITY_DN1029_c0_g1_i1.p1 TRINITY_DN1029_c0_g1~~TRINITY_DN1029_c0_g1_i1.p1  ORF type:complete len:315 (+),score=57.89 TRINITY_DN1029_c0_g1_i1:134-946(+)